MSLISKKDIALVKSFGISVLHRIGLTNLKDEDVEAYKEKIRQSAETNSNLEKHI